MKTLLLLLPVLALPLRAEPADSDLLKYVRERASLERVTPVPVDAKPAPFGPCGPAAGGLRGPQFFDVYADDSAVMPLFDPWGKFPEGSVILKEQRNGAKRFFAGMIKREQGYFPESGDWEFFAADQDASKILERGKLQNCAGCHGEFSKGGFVARIGYTFPAQVSGGRIVLHSSKATVEGEKLHYESQENKNTLGYWVNAADKAHWNFEAKKPGVYAIHVWQGCGKGSAGSEVEISCAGQRSRFTVEETGHFQNFKERKVGKVRFGKAGPQKLEVRALSKPGAAVMDLRLVVLVPEP